jgi:hypothetical protein
MKKLLIFTLLSSIVAHNAIAKTMAKKPGIFRHITRAMEGYNWMPAYTDGAGNVKTCQDLLENPGLPYDGEQVNQYLQAFKACAEKYREEAETGIQKNLHKWNVLPELASQLYSNGYRFSDELNNLMIDNSLIYTIVVAACSGEPNNKPKY